MILITFKLIAVVSIFLLTLCAGLIPLRFAIKRNQLFHLGDAFASGIFLSAALIHLLPDAEVVFHKIYGSDSYPLAELYCIITFVFLLVIEHGAAIYSKYRKSNHSHNHDAQYSPADSNNLALQQDMTEQCGCGKNIFTPILLLLVLSIHSFVEGAAIGISPDFASALIIFIAVIVHKGSESLALASNLYRYALQLKHIGRLIILFSFMTPLGILLASLVNDTISGNTGLMLEAIFNAIAAGTFLYLGTVHIMKCEKSFENFNEIFALILGVILMSTVALWI